eukprot:COSAG03_NODE_507_length_7348_cov_8.004966_9_plen_42_part_00
MLFQRSRWLPNAARTVGCVAWASPVPQTDKQAGRQAGRVAG